MNTCVICKKEFEIRHHLAVNRTICYDNDCIRTRANNHQRKHLAKRVKLNKIPKTVKCINCKLDFVITDPKKLHMKICSEECRKERQQDQISIHNFKKNIGKYL